MHQTRKEKKLNAWIEEIKQHQDSIKEITKLLNSYTYSEITTKGLEQQIKRHQELIKYNQYRYNYILS